MMHGEHGIEHVALSMPCIIGKDGIETIVPISLDEEETRQLIQSATVLKEMIAQIES